MVEEEARRLKVALARDERAGVDERVVARLGHRDEGAASEGRHEWEAQREAHALHATMQAETRRMRRAIAAVNDEV